MLGSVIADRYMLVEQIGSGGMGTVFRAIDQRTGGEVAVKLPHPWLAQDHTFISRLRREAEIAASLSSSRVVRVIDFGFSDHQPYLVMEYVPGETLADILSERGALDWQTVAQIGIDIARALDAAHQRGIVHRDLKPANIKVTDDTVKVLDFGIARAEGYHAVTAASTFLGTPEYTAPERFGMPTDPTKGPEELAEAGDIRSDIYSLGIILHETLTGRLPFQARNPWAMLRAHVIEEPEPLPDSVPAGLRSIVSRCLAKQPAERYQTPRELLLALSAVLAEAGYFNPSDSMGRSPAPDRLREVPPPSPSVPPPAPAASVEQPATPAAAPNAQAAYPAERVSLALVAVIAVTLALLAAVVIFAVFGRGASPPEFERSFPDSGVVATLAVLPRYR